MFLFCIYIYLHLSVVFVSNWTSFSKSVPMLTDGYFC